MPKLKRTQNPRSAWTTFLLVIGVSALFGFVVLPYLGKKNALEGTHAPDFVLPVIHGGDPGNRIRLSDLRGKVVVVDFWASWCVPCRTQAPIIDTLAKRHGDELAVVGVSTNDERDAAVRFAKGQNLSYPMVFDENNRVATEYSVTGLPTLVVVDKSGKIVAVRQRVVPETELEALVGKARGG